MCCTRGNMYESSAHTYYSVSDSVRKTAFKHDQLLTVDKYNNHVCQNLIPDIARPCCCNFVYSFFKINLLHVLCIFKYMFCLCVLMIYVAYSIKQVSLTECCYITVLYTAILPI